RWAPMRLALERSIARRSALVACKHNRLSRRCDRSAAVGSRASSFLPPAPFGSRFAGVLLSPPVLREDVRDAVDGVADVAGQERDRGDHREGDDGEDDAVLGHRLTLLATAEGARRIGDERLSEGEQLEHGFPSLRSSREAGPTASIS